MQIIDADACAQHVIRKYLISNCKASIEKNDEKNDRVRQVMISRLGVDYGRVLRRFGAPQLGVHVFGSVVLIIAGATVVYQVGPAEDGTQS